MPLHAWSPRAIHVPAARRSSISDRQVRAAPRSRAGRDGIVPPERVARARPRVARRSARSFTPRTTSTGSLTGTLTRDEDRTLGFPWSERLVERSYRSAGGTVEAARCALEHGVAMNLAGGTHHAFPDHGEGFCVFNDVAVAIRALQRDGRIARAAIVDLDVHQGNGTHAVFAGDDPGLHVQHARRARTIRSTRCRARSTSSCPMAPATTSISRCSLGALPAGACRGPGRPRHLSRRRRSARARPARPT